MPGTSRPSWPLNINVQADVATVIDDESVFQQNAVFLSPAVFVDSRNYDPDFTAPSQIGEDTEPLCFAVVVVPYQRYEAPSTDEVFPAAVEDDNTQGDTLVRRAWKIVQVVADEEIVPSPGFTLVEEEFGQPALIFSPPTALGLLLVEDDFPQQTATTLVEEQDWQAQVVPPPPIIASFFVQNDEVFPQTTPLPIDEMYWLTFQAGPDVSKVNVAWQSQFEDDVPVLTGPIIPPDTPGGEFIVRARRRLIR